MINTELCFLSIAQMAEQLRKKAVSPVELTQAYLDRVARVDGQLNSYLSVTTDRAVQEARRAEAEALQRALAPLGIVPGAFDRAEGSDIGPMLTDGLPGVTLAQDGTYYFDVHHTPDDTLDKIDLGDLRQNVAAWTTMLAVLSGGVEPKRSGRR